MDEQIGEAEQKNKKHTENENISVEKICLVYTLDMPTLLGFFLSSFFANILVIFFPIMLIFSTAGMVLFSDDGLFENVAVHEKILRFEQKSTELNEVNAKLRHDIYVLKLRKDKMLHRTSFEYLAAPKGSQIYRFEEKEE